MSERKVAVLGLGLIGSIWARHYNNAGQLAASWNRSPKSDLPFEQSSLGACAKAAQVLHLCLYDADSVREVLGRLLPDLGQAHLVMQSSTIDGDSAAEFAALVESTGASYLEAPFTGSKPAAEIQQTIFYLGGEASVVEAASPFLDTLSNKRFLIGTPMQTAAIKLAMNLQVVGMTQALCEAITLCRQVGLNDDTFFEVMRANASWSGLAALKEPKLRAADFSPQFTTKNMHKDMRLAQKTAKKDMPLLDLIAACLAASEAAGFGSEDFISLIRSLEAE